MKTLVITIKDPAANDHVFVSYYDPRGGRTDVSYRVMGERLKPIPDEHGVVTRAETIPADTPIDVARALMRGINKDWMSESFKAKLKEDGSLVINCNDAVDRVTFKSHVDGGGGTKVELVEF